MSEQSADGTVKTAITDRLINAAAFYLARSTMTIHLDPEEQFRYYLETTPHLVLGLIQIIVNGKPSRSVVDGLKRKAGKDE